MIFISDIHFSEKQSVARIDDVWQTGKQKLNYLFQFASVNNMPIVQAGDLTHTPRSWQCLSFLIDLFDTYPNMKDNFYCVYGQHDMVGLNTNDTIMSSLIKIGYARLLSEQPVTINGLPVYGVSWGQELPAMNSGRKIIVCHASVSCQKHNFKTYPIEAYCKGVEDAVFLFGDIHIPFNVEFGSNIAINTGSLIRRSIDESDNTPHFYTYADNLQYWEIPYAKDVFSDKHLELKAYQEQSKISVQDFVDSVADWQKGKTFGDNLNDFIAGCNDDNVKTRLLELWGQNDA